MGLLGSVTFQLLLRMPSSCSSHFSDPVVEISDHHVENVIYLCKINTVIYGSEINGVGSSMAIITLTIMWKITTKVSFNDTYEN